MRIFGPSQGICIGGIICGGSCLCAASPTSHRHHFIFIVLAFSWDRGCPRCNAHVRGGGGGGGRRYFSQHQLASLIPLGAFTLTTYSIPAGACQGLARQAGQAPRR